MDDLLSEAIENLRAIREDGDSSKRFKEKVGAVIAILESGGELSVEKALSELEEINAIDFSTYLRTQLWVVISLLESIEK